MKIIGGFMKKIIVFIAFSLFFAAFCYSGFNFLKPKPTPTTTPEPAVSNIKTVSAQKTETYNNVRLLDKECKEFGKRFLIKYKNIFDDNSKYAFFYSQRCDTCIMTQIDLLGSAFHIFDIKENFIKSYTQNSFALLFSCRKKQCANIILKVVEKNNGNIEKVPITELTDDGEGESALNLSGKTYSRNKCQKLFNAKLKEIK
jgi:hypothetical protein